MPMDDHLHDLGEPEPKPRSRDNVDDRDFTTPERAGERAAEDEPRSEGVPPTEHPEDGRSTAAGKARPEPDAGERR